MNKKFFFIGLVILVGLTLTIQFKDRLSESKDVLVGARTTSRNTSEDAFVVGSNVASGSNAYIGEFVSTGTVSLNFQGTSSNKGTCIQLQNTVGGPVYLRVVGTTLTVNTVRCR